MTELEASGKVEHPPPYIIFVVVFLFFLTGLLGFLICHLLKKKGYRCRAGDMNYEEEEEENKLGGNAGGLILSVHSGKSGWVRDSKIQLNFGFLSGYSGFLPQSEIMQTGDNLISYSKIVVWIVSKPITHNESLEYSPYSWLFAILWPFLVVFVSFPRAFGLQGISGSSLSSKAEFYQILSSSGNAIHALLFTVDTSLYVIQLSKGLIDFGD